MDESVASSSNSEQQSKSTNEKKTTEENDQLIDPFMDFECQICHLKEKCIFGELNVIDGRYDSPVYFMRDPFQPPSKTKGKKPSHDDFLVVGAPCSLCNQPTCFDEKCSIFFNSNFCVSCVSREKRRFPASVIQKVMRDIAKGTSDSTKT